MARRGRPPYPDVLTPREFEVLALLREGLSNDEIAETLGISLAGAKYHVSEILGKLGVASREEAAAWSASGGRPWWAAAFAPLVWLRRLGWPQAAALVAAIAVAAGLGFLIWGLVRTNGNDERLVAAPTSTSATPTSTPNLPPLPTRTPFAGSPIDCPGAFTSPEEAIEACLGAHYPPGYIYVGDCDTPTPATPGTGFDRPCSYWEDGAVSPRSYLISNVSVDGIERLILTQEVDGWTVGLTAGCSNQNEIDEDSVLDARRADLSQVRIDDCRLPPPPLERPVLRIGIFEGSSVENGRTRLTIRATSYSQRGIKLSISVENISNATLPWTSDVAAGITLTADDGTVYPVSEVGGSLARSIPEGIPPGAVYYG